jgi:type IV pilus assembly protein PilQ
MLLPAALLLAIDGSTSGVQASGPAELLPDLPLAAVNAPNRINGLTVVEQDDGSTTIRLKGTRKPTFNVYRLSNPERLVVDVSGSERGAAVPHVPLDTWSVGRVTVDSVNEKGAKLARIVLNLKRESSYIVVPNDKDLVVTVTPREVPPEAYFARKSAGKRKAEIEGMRRDADAYKEAAEQQASTAEKRAKAAETKLAKLDTETQKRTRASEKKLGEAEQRVKEAQAKLRNVETARRMSARQRRKMESAKQELEAAKKDLQAQTSDLKKQLAVARKQKAKAEREAATARQRLDGELAAKRKEFDAEVAAMRSEGKREADALRAKAATEAAAQRKSAQAEAAALKKEAAAVKARSKREAAELRKQAATLRADGETQAAALRAKGAREAAALRKQGENEAAAARKLAERKLAAAETAMAAAKNERQQAAAARKEAEKALADAQKAKKRAKSKRKAELKRAVEQAQAAEKAARKRQHDAESQLGAISADRARLAKLLDEQSKKAAALEKSINSKNDELSTVEAKVRDARAKVDALGGAVTKSDVEQARSQAQRAAATATVLTKEVDRLRKNAAAARKRADDAEASLGKLKKRRSKARSKQLDEARKIATEERAKARAAAKRLGEREKKLAAVSNELAGKKAQAVALESKLDNLASKSDSLKRKNKSARKALGKAEADLAGVQGELERENQRLAQLQGKVKEAESKLDKTLAETKHHASVDGEWQKQRNAAGAARVKDVRFEDSRDESRIIIELDGPMEYAGSNITPRMKLLKLNGAAIPKQLERSLDASAYKGPVATVTSFREGDDVKVIVSTREDTKAELEEKPGQLIWKFPRKRAKGKPEVVSLAGSKVSGFASPPRPLATGSSFERRSKWRGERIDIELQDAPIKDVLLLFSDIGRVNIIAGQGVDGVVTMRLTHVPWDQALDIILKSLGLGMVQEGNVVRVATLQALEEERRKAIERANAQVQLKPLNTRLVPLSYASVGDMIPKVQSVLSSRGSVTPDTRTNTLIIMDVAENIALAEQLVGSLDAQTPQVLIEARIVEARTNWLRQLGIQWGFDYTASGGTGNPTGLLFPNSMGVAGGSGDANPDVRGLLLPPAALGNPNYAVDLPAPVGSGAGGALGFTFGSISGNLNTNLRLSAAEDEGEVRIISAPKIVTLNNNQAQIEQGVQIPISQVSAQGVNTRYVNATLALRVTPQVTNEGSVMLDVQVQKNEADFINTGARGDPTILTKQAQSQMLITDGDTAVIGGIYTRNQSVNRKKVPWLADIPVIGWFFKNKSEADTRTEVLIFLTPKIVNRAASIGG